MHALLKVTVNIHLLTSDTECKKPKFQQCTQGTYWHSWVVAWHQSQRFISERQLLERCDGRAALEGKDLPGGADCTFVDTHTCYTKIKKKMSPATPRNQRKSNPACLQTVEAEGKKQCPANATGSNNTLINLHRSSSNPTPSQIIAKSSRTTHTPRHKHRLSETRPHAHGHQEPVRKVPAHASWHTRT